MDFPISTSPFYDWKSDYRNGAEEVHGSCSVVVRIHEGIDEIYSGVVNISCVGAHGGLKEIRHRVNHLREPLLIMHYPPPFGASKGDSKKSSKFKQMFPTNFAHQSGVNFPKVDYDELGLTLLLVLMFAWMPPPPPVFTLTLTLSPCTVKCPTTSISPRPSQPPGGKFAPGRYSTYSKE